VGRVLPVIIDESDGIGGATGRSQADAPEIDGRVLLRDAGALVPGDIVQVRVEDADAFDLYAVPC
jgi:ribosomal protein S12 methylthiotransferase